MGKSCRAGSARSVSTPVEIRLLKTDLSVPTTGVQICHLERLVLLDSVESRDVQCAFSFYLEEEVARLQAVVVCLWTVQ